MAAILVAPQVAAASAACSFNANAVLRITADDRFVISRDGDDLLFDGLRCEIPGSGGEFASQHNTREVRVLGTAANEVVRLLEDGSPFAPGVGETASGSPELEFLFLLGEGSDRFVVRGGNGDDHFVAGANGVNLNAAETTDEDVDLRWTSVRGVTFLTAGGSDTVSADGGSATGDALGIEVRIDSGAGDDRIDGGSAGDLLAGRGGADVLRGLAGSDALIGGAGADTEAGGNNSDLFFEGLRRNGADRLFGGGGRDLVFYSLRSHRLQLTLDGAANDGAIATATKDAEGDFLAGDIEILFGGPDRDVIGGGDGRQIIFGDFGQDHLSGFDGDDLFIAEDGEIDTVNGGPGEDRCQCDPGDIRSSVSDPPSLAGAIPSAMIARAVQRMRAIA